MDHLQYLLLLAACLIVTAPLEWVLGARVYRSPKRLVRALAGPVAVFVVWDLFAIDRRDWAYNARYVSGWSLPGRLPVEELLFFVVIPICALLTFDLLERARDRA